MAFCLMRWSDAVLLLSPSNGQHTLSGINMGLKAMMLHGSAQMAFQCGR